jgi:hypothetical protein
MHNADHQISTATVVATLSMALILMFIAASAAFDVERAPSHRLTSSIRMHGDPFAGFRPCLIKSPSCLSLDDTPVAPCLLSMERCAGEALVVREFAPCARSLAECAEQRTKER